MTGHLGVSEVAMSLLYSVVTVGLAYSSDELSNHLRDRVAEGVAKVYRAQSHFVELCKAYKNLCDQGFTWWRYGDSNPGPLACHAVFFSSLTFAGDRRRLQYWGFNSPVFRRDRTRSSALLKALLKKMIAQKDPFRFHHLHGPTSQSRLVGAL